MRIPRVSLALAFGASVFGCSKDGEVLDFVRENDALVAEIKKSPDPDAARKAFEAKKGTLKSKFDSLKDARGFQIEEETMTALQKSAQNGVDTICQLAVAGDEATNDKYRRLCDDYASVVTKSK